MKFKIGEIVYVGGKKGRISGYSDVSHRYKVKIGSGQFSYLQDRDIKREDEPWRKK